MAIWVLEPVEGLPDIEEENPWEPWFDKADGFVVRAESEPDAPRVTAEHSLEEGSRAWLNPSFSSCIRIAECGDRGLIMMSVHNA